MTYRTFTLQLKPTPRQVVALEDLFAFQRELYNAAIEERSGAYRWEKRGVYKREQYKQLTGWDDPRLKRFGVVAARGSLFRVDRAFKAFFRRVKAGETPGYPRFKSDGRFKSVEWDCSQSGWSVVDRTHLRVTGVGHIKVALRKGQRGVSGIPKTLTIRKRGGKYEAFVFCQAEEHQPRESTGKESGLDVGIASFATLSDGEQFENPRWFRESEANLTAKQRKRARHKRGSSRNKELNRQVGMTHQKIANQRKDFHHKLSKQLVARFDLIVVEDLAIENMVKSPKPKPDGEGGYLPNGKAAKGGLNKSIADAGWGQFVRMIGYKAEDAGVQLVRVEPRHTSQRCHECGHTAKANRVTQAEFRCQRCGHTAHADVNAAKNILRLGQSLRDSSDEREAPSEAA